MLCIVITVLLGSGAGWGRTARLVGRYEGEGEVKGGGDKGVCLSGEWCCLLTWSSIRKPPHPSPHYQNTHTHAHTSLHPLPISVRLSARPGISTLISHLWRPNELRLLVHLWDPTDYQTGGDHLSMARGGTDTADLATKERRIPKWGRKEKSRKKDRKGKGGNQQLQSATVFSGELWACVHVPRREQGFVGYWIEGSGVGLRHQLTLARAAGTPWVSITVAALRPTPGEKPQKLPGERKKLVKI